MNVEELIDLIVTISCSIAGLMFIGAICYGIIMMARSDD